ncbi:hypothetical protein [Zhongshania sp. BJYM1]|uniref:hypothetical protein n=1 Tax=Zhongshania aquatica TaxID=2965069 RepID=UPI0022B2EB0B|nr:hypothetical protein [Marortus sp. BJYM1]
MAINADPSRKPQGHLVIGTTGAGKSQVCKNRIPSSGVRLVAFDPDGDHSIPYGKPDRFAGKRKWKPCIGFDSMAQFSKTLRQADLSGKPYRIAYTGAKKPVDFERFCLGVWDILDGDVDTHVILEEVGQFTASSGPALADYGDLLRRGRKYGCIPYTVAQRSAEVPSTARQNSRFRYVGLVDGEDDAKSAQKYAGVSWDKLLEIEPDTLTFYLKETGRPAEKVQLNYIE